MVGYISDAVATAIKSWQKLQTVGIVPVRATESTTMIVDTALPAIVVQVMGDNGEGNVFIGGSIRQYFDLILYVLTPVNNYSFTMDGGFQAKMLDLSDEVIRCMERTTAFDELRTEHDFNIQFDRMDTETTYGTRGSNTVTVEVHKVVYKGSVNFEVGSDEVTEVVLEKENFYYNENDKQKTSTND